MRCIEKKVGDQSRSRFWIWIWICLCACAHLVLSSGDVDVWLTSAYFMGVSEGPSRHWIDGFFSLLRVFYQAYNHPGDKNRECVERTDLP